MLITKGVNTDGKGSLVSEDAGDLTLGLGLGLADERGLAEDGRSRGGKKGEGGRKRVSEILVIFVNRKQTMQIL